MLEQISQEIASDPFYQANFPNDGQRFVAWYLRRVLLRDDAATRDDITDGADDKQIDAVIVDDTEQRVLIIQGKFINAGQIDAEPLREVLAAWVRLQDLGALQKDCNERLKKKIEAIRTALDDDYRVDFELLTTGTLTDAAQADLTAYADKFSEFDAFTASLHLVDRAAVETRLAEARVQPAIRHTIKLDPAKTFSMDLPGARTVIAAVPLRECLNLPGEVAALIDAINKQPTLVVDPRATAKALEATGEILPLAATCIENAMQSVRMQDEAANKVFSPQNWLRANRSWQGETLVAGTQAGMLGSFAGGGVLMERAKVPATAFTARWSAD